MIESTKEKRYEIVLALAHEISVLEYGFSHHVKVEPIRVHLVIVLIHALVQHVCTVSYLFDIELVFFNTSLKLLLSH